MHYPKLVLGIMSSTIVSVGLAFPEISLAQISETSYCSSGYQVYFGNGIAYDELNANTSKNLIQAGFGNTFGNEPVSYAVSINPTGGFLRDLLEAFAQKRAEDPTLSWQLFFRWVSGEFISTSLSVLLDDYFQTSGSRRLAQAVASLSQPAAYSDPTVVRHSQTYRDALLAGKRVLVVAHSQGNLYANATYNSLRSQNVNVAPFSIAAVATPANSVATNEGYVTTDADRVIELVRILAPATLPDNDQSVPDFPAPDRFGHGFNEIYAGNAFPALRSRTFGLVSTALNRLSQVPTQSAAGPITTTLTWSSPGDVDLHAYEPNYHVYYGQRRGLVGYLDRDDTTGTGPEHYYAQCSTFAPGNYRFGVNYYSGSGSKVATVKVSVLGISYPERTIVLTSPRGSGGDNSPTVLFNVKVTKDSTGAYSAVVE